MYTVPTNTFVPEYSQEAPLQELGCLEVIASGQSLVLYDGADCIGGGIIV